MYIVFDLTVLMSSSPVYSVSDAVGDLVYLGCINIFSASVFQVLTLFQMAALWCCFVCVFY